MFIKVKFYFTIYKIFERTYLYKCLNLTVYSPQTFYIQRYYLLLKCIHDDNQTNIKSINVGSNKK